METRNRDGSQMSSTNLLLLIIMYLQLCNHDIIMQTSRK